jgi:hypothetical protein
MSASFLKRGPKSDKHSKSKSPSSVPTHETRKIKISWKLPNI